MYSKLKRPLLLGLGAVASFALAAGTAATTGRSIVVVEAASATVDDVLKASDLDATDSQTYVVTSGVQKESGVTYYANSATNYGAIQIRSSKSNSGIVATANPAGRNIIGVSLVWNSHTSSSRELQVYVSDKAYASSEDLYGNNEGTLVGSIEKSSTVTSIDIPEQYQLPFVGVRSADGALYLDSITFSWSDDSSEPVPELGTLESISIDTSSVKDSYAQGDIVDWSGLLIKAKDVAGVEKTFDYADKEVSIEPANGTILTEAGGFEAEVSLTIDGVTKTASFNYHVDERTITTYVKATSQTFENALLGSALSGRSGGLRVSP